MTSSNWTSSSDRTSSGRPHFTERLDLNLWRGIAVLLFLASAVLVVALFFSRTSAERYRLQYEQAAREAAEAADSVRYLGAYTEAQAAAQAAEQAAEAQLRRYYARLLSTNRENLEKEVRRLKKRLKEAGSPLEGDVDLAATFLYAGSPYEAADTLSASRVESGERSHTFYFSKRDSSAEYQLEADLEVEAFLGARPSASLIWHVRLTPRPRRFSLYSVTKALPSGIRVRELIVDVPGNMVALEGAARPPVEQKASRWHIDLEAGLSASFVPSRSYAGGLSLALHTPLPFYLEGEAGLGMDDALVVRPYAGLSLSVPLR